MQEMLDIRPHTMVNARNTERALKGGLAPSVAIRELGHIETVLSFEYQQLIDMDLVVEPLSPVDVNPNLTIFLDGPEGMGGYADVYATVEWAEAGTRIEMEQEKTIMRKHLLGILTHTYIEELKRNHKPLVIVEGGAGPDLRTISTVTGVLLEKANELSGVPIQMVHVDISKRMAAITAAKVRLSGIPEELADHALDVQMAISHADVFDLLNKIPDESLTYALLPFGVLSFGLDGHDPSDVVAHIAKKMRQGGGILGTVYNSQWRDYTDLVEHVVEQVNMTKTSDDEKMQLSDLNPFVIKILDGQMQVGGGLAFDCRTYTMEELQDIVALSGLRIDHNVNTPKGWAYWPGALLKTVVDGKVFPGGLPETPPEHLMNSAKSLILDGMPSDELKKLLADAIPNGREMISQAPAPYITITATKYE
jgi:hypothetical protein